MDIPEKASDGFQSHEQAQSASAIALVFLAIANVIWLIGVIEASIFTMHKGVYVKRQQVCLGLPFVGAKGTQTVFGWQRYPNYLDGKGTHTFWTAKVHKLCWVVKVHKP